MDSPNTQQSHLIFRKSHFLNSTLTLGKFVQFYSLVPKDQIDLDRKEGDKDGGEERERKGGRESWRKRKEQERKRVKINSCLEEL